MPRMDISSSRPNASRVPVAAGVAGAAVALVVLTEGWLAFALSEQTPDRAAGGLLLAAGLLTGAAAVAALLKAPSGRPFVLAAAGGLLLAGPIAAALSASTRPVFAADLLLLGAVPVAGSLLLLALARRGVSGTGRGAAGAAPGR